MIEVNKAIPEFSAQATSEITVTNESIQGKNVIFYFYPRDSTPGCTTEGKEFRDAIEDFKEANTIIYGISKCSMKKHENFKAKQLFPFELISDPEEILCKLFDVIKLKKLYGKEYMGIERSTFLFDKSGILKQEWRKVKVKGHVAEVLKASQAL